MHTSQTPRHTLRPAMALLLAALAAAYSSSVTAADTSPAQQASRWNTEAGSPGDAVRGETFFRSKHGKKWACTSCHQDPPVKPGKHAATGKIIDPLAPAFNPKAFTDTKRIDKWFRRNCNDVLGRECTAAEKADVVTYLNGIRR